VKNERYVPNIIYLLFFCICIVAGLANRYGLSAAKFAENVRAHYAVNKVENFPVSPQGAAEEFLSE